MQPYALVKQVCIFFMFFQPLSILFAQGVECVDWQAKHPSWLWCDDFENDSSLENNYFEVNRADGRFGVLDEASFGGASSLRSTYVPGQSEHGNIKIAIGQTPMTPGIEPTQKFDELFWRFYLMTGSNWVGNGHKLSRAVVFAKPWIPAVFGHVWQDNNLGLAIDPATTVVGNEVTGNTYNDWENLNWMGAKDDAETQIFAPENRGQWFCIEVRLKLNTPNEEDGQFQMWINNQLEADLQGLNLRGGYDEYGINAIHLENYKGGGSEQPQSRYFDNFVVSTKNIGCYEQPSLSPPRPPTNFYETSEPR